MSKQHTDGDRRFCGSARPSAVRAAVERVRQRARSGNRCDCHQRSIESYSVTAKQRVIVLRMTLPPCTSMNLCTAICRATSWLPVCRHTAGGDRRQSAKRCQSVARQPASSCQSPAVDSAVVSSDATSDGRGSVLSTRCAALLRAGNNVRR